MMVRMLPGGSREEFRKVLEGLLAHERVLLYTEDGKPVLQNSDLCIAGEAEWRAAVTKILEEGLAKFELSLVPPSPAELEAALKRYVRSDPKQTIDIIDGKIALPFKLRVGPIQLKAHVPVYKLLTLATTAAGIWLLKPKTLERTEPARKDPTAPIEITITVGTVRSLGNLLRALTSNRIDVTEGAGLLLEKISFVQNPTNLDLVIAQPALFDITATSNWTDFERQCARRGLYPPPAEAGPQLCLQWRLPFTNDAPLTIAMQPVTVNEHGNSAAFCLDGDPSGRPVLTRRIYAAGFQYSLSSRYVWSRQRIDAQGYIAKKVVTRQDLAS